MKNLRLKLKALLIILFFIFSLPSCNNEELYVYDQTTLTEETPSNEDEITSILTVDDNSQTFENTSLELVLYANDDNLPLNFTIEHTEPSNGVLSIDNNQTLDNPLDDKIIYTPNDGFFGNDSFDYTLCDVVNTENCDTATVIVEVTEVIKDDIATELKAFPSAEGAGAKATGGRGGVVLHVTNLNDSGPGSFREALIGDNSTTYKRSPRTIVFDVSGTIVLSGDINTPSLMNFTIAGQTAPEGGITIQCPKFAIARAENAIIRYIRIVNTTYFDRGTKSTAINLAGANNVIVDHISIRYTPTSPAFNFQDDNDTNNGQGEMTIQRSLIGDCLTGGIVGGVVQQPRASLAGTNSVRHNLFAHVDHRFPNVAGDAQAEIIGNVIYNYRARLNTFFNDSETNFENNTFKAGPSSKFFAARNKIGEYVGGDIRVYTSGNRIINDTGNSLASTDTDWNSLFVIWANSLNQAVEFTPTKETEYRSDTRFPDLGVPITSLSAEDDYTSVLNDVGANKYLNADGSVGTYLDIQDQRYIDDTKNGTMWNGGTSHVNKTDRNALVYPVLPTNTREASFDTDRDGIADDWEIRNFGDLSRDGTGDFDGDSYTDLEEYLNLVDKLN